MEKRERIERNNSFTNAVRYVSRRQEFIPMLVLLILIIILSIANSNFLQISTFTNLFQSVAPMGIVALGAMFVIITSGIDFTSGFGLAVAGVSAGVLYAKTDYNLAVLILTGLVIGILIGLVNGTIITKFKVSPFITTLAMMSVLQGLSLLISQGQRLLINDPKALWLGQGRIGFIPVSFLILLIFAVIAHLLLTKTKFGVYVFSMGGNEQALTYSGVNVDIYKIMVYTLAGFFTGLGSVITISRIALITPNISGTILLDAIASTIIGGTKISGGKGSVFGTIIGVLIMGLITMALTYLNVDNLLRDAVKGGIIVTALFLNYMTYKDS